ncbi:MAG TPA: ABC transporter permease [Ktedonobacterales bacterium]|nr:ABC transporter permease [Ktedonobacterales bacterium]
MTTSPFVDASQAPTSFPSDAHVATDTPLGAPDSDPTRTRTTGVQGRAALWAATTRATLRTLAAWLPALALLAALIALWQWYASQPQIDAEILPTPLAIWRVLVAQRGILWANTLVTLNETAVGFGAALATGLAFGALIDASPWLRRALYPLLVTSQTIPIIALAPLLVLWFGFGLTSKAIVIALVCFFPITVAFADGLRSADPDLIRLYRSFGAGRLRIFWSVRLPGSLPTLFSGVRIAVAYSMIGAIFGEYVGAVAGLGYYIELKQHSFATAGVLAAIAVVAALSVALFALVALIERLALPWYYAQRRA